ncbi:WxL domain-containing protein [Vagococcus sp. BWB3-3]|uniref:WxL domain-containing protein n=2 Tax=Vagococcus allomyrinae TaxID=2794353 RepID=A0A940PJY7_9ENTE|nr:WxL domain-containing protein [Vagococcus allomyrinae]
MKIHQLTMIGILAGGVLLLSPEVSAEPDRFGQGGSVTVVGSDVTKPVDPENPEEVVDPGEGPSTEGKLRIDFVSTLNFGQARIDKDNRKFNAQAQQFTGETGPRGSYIQITDQRAGSNGWAIQVKQDFQFRNASIEKLADQELRGAVLSLDGAWANSSGSSEAPTVTRDTVELTAIGTTYELARANNGAGSGVWTVAFGASSTNSNQQATTLSPILDKAGLPVIDTLTGKPSYENSAISLFVPQSTKIHPVDYRTELTWIVSSAP